jgi:hypothetical protein
MYTAAVTSVAQGTQNDLDFSTPPLEQGMHYLEVIGFGTGSDETTKWQM